MVGSGLKKLAAEHGMKIAHGVAYGNFHGYACTLSEGAGWKRIAVATQFPDFARQEALREELGQYNLTRDYRVQGLLFEGKSIVITFQDNPGTMEKIRAFADWFFPKLWHYSATRSGACAHCGNEVSESDRWRLISGTAYPMHDICAQQVRSELEQESDDRRLTDTGSYASGFFGALLGAVVGSVLWAIVLNFGFVASIIGFVIGWLAEKGYRLCRGRQGKGKLAILIIVTILGVLLGNLGADIIAIVQMINAGELPGLGYGDIFWMFIVLLTDSEYITATLSNIGLGLLFAFLGIYSLLKRTKNEVSSPQMVDLN